MSSINICCKTIGFAITLCGKMYYFLGYKTLFEWYLINLVLRSNRRELPHLISDEVGKQLNMQKSDAKQKSRFYDRFWDFLTETSLSEYKSDDIGDTLIAGSLFQAIQDLDIPPECLHKIERTLMESVEQTRVRFNLPIVIRLFYGKKMIRSESSAKTASDLQRKQTIEPAHMIHPSGTKIFGGWGFFIIERARDFPAGSIIGSPNLIDLYVYQEGE